jgi:tetratricopeptide (TPR) repeat protein
MTIMDRQNLDKILANQAESASGNYSEDDYIRIGELINARYILAGSITKTATNYMLELSVSDAESGVRKASYTPKPVSPLSLQDLSAIKQAAADLLAQLGVRLTDKGKSELAATVNASAVNAETALSKAITAQKNGTTVEALSYYYQAVNYDPSLSEAASRLNVLQADVSSGNIGADARNDIQWRKDWIARLTECEAFFAKYTKDPPGTYSLVYTTNLQQENIDYARETLDLSFQMYLSLDSEQWFKTVESVVKTVQDGLKQTGRMEAWGLDWPRKSVSGVTPFVERKAAFDVAVELVNEKGKVIGKQSVRLPYGWTVGGFGDGRYDKGDGILRITPVDNGDYRVGVRFSSVKADDITDSLRISVPSIDGEKAQSASQNKRISIITYDEYVKNKTRSLYNYKIGDRGPAGGFIFYDRGNYWPEGWRYLEAAPSDCGKAEWGAYGKDVAGTQTSVGSGKQNTQLIVDFLKGTGETGRAAQLCTGLNTGGYQDWFFPSKDELDLMYKNLKAKGLGDFTNDRYWSSSQYNSNLSWEQRFSDGHQATYNQAIYNKGNPNCVRAVRAF